MVDRYRANYARLSVLEQLGPTEATLDLPWAQFTGDATSRYEFTVPTDGAVDPYIQLQVYDVGTYGHEILLNDEALAGFDLPPAEDWQYWMDAVTGESLREGTNTLQIKRDESTPDAFAVGTVVVNWREPID